MAGYPVVRRVVTPSGSGCGESNPLRESLSLLYRQLADYCEAKYSLLTQHVDPEKALPPLLARQQKAVDMISQCYQQLHMLAANNNNDYKRLRRVFQVALDLQEHIAVSLHQPQEVQELVERSHAEEVIRWNAQTVAARLRVIADDILYHRYPKRFNMDKQIGALEKIARQHPDNPVGQFCAWHFSQIARVLRTQAPLYVRDLMAEKQRRLPLIPALKSYLSLKSSALRNAARISVMLSIASLMGSALHLPKPYWIMMTVMFVTQTFMGRHACASCTGGRHHGRADHCRRDAALPRTGRLHAHRDADCDAGELSDYPQKLRLGDGRFYPHRGLYTPVAYTEWRPVYCCPSYRYVDRLPDSFWWHGLAVASMAKRPAAKNAHDALETYQDAIRLILSDDPRRRRWPGSACG